MHLCCNFLVDVVLDPSVKTIDESFTQIIICESDRRDIRELMTEQSSPCAL